MQIRRTYSPSIDGLLKALEAALHGNNSKEDPIDGVRDLPMASAILDGSLAEYCVSLGLTEGPRPSREELDSFLCGIGMPCTTIVWGPDPITSGRAARLALGGVSLQDWDERSISGDIDPLWVEDEMSKGTPPKLDPSCGRSAQHDGYWVGYFMALAGGSALDLSLLVKYLKVVAGCSWFFVVGDTAIFSPSYAPHVHHSTGELHNCDGPVMGDIYAIEGAIIPQELEWPIRKPGEISRDRVDGIGDPFFRQAFKAHFPQSYITSPPIQSDIMGELYDVGEDFRLVKVYDGTEKDKEYWLRVSAQADTAREAVASTFGLRPEEYAPMIET